MVTIFLPYYQLVLDRGVDVYSLAPVCTAAQWLISVFSLFFVFIVLLRRFKTSLFIVCFMPQQRFHNLSGCVSQYIVIVAETEMYYNHSNHDW